MNRVVVIGIGMYKLDGIELILIFNIIIIDD